MHILSYVSAPLQLRYATWGAIQELYAFAFAYVGSDKWRLSGVYAFQCFQIENSDIRSLIRPILILT